MFWWPSHKNTHLAAMLWFWYKVYIYKYQYCTTAQHVEIRCLFCDLLFEFVDTKCLTSLSGVAASQSLVAADLAELGKLKNIIVKVGESLSRLQLTVSK